MAKSCELAEMPVRAGGLDTAGGAGGFEVRYDLAENTNVSDLETGADAAGLCFSSAIETTGGLWPGLTLDWLPQIDGGTPPNDSSEAAGRGPARPSAE